jgi:hypothetical protein
VEKAEDVCHRHPREPLVLELLPELLQASSLELLKENRSDGRLQVTANDRLVMNPSGWMEIRALGDRAVRQEGRAALMPAP